MAEFKCISVAEAKSLIAGKAPVIVDVRDVRSFQAASLPGAHNVTTRNFRSFRKASDPSQPVLIYCYHGNASREMAQMFIDFGFEEVYSMDGGFEAWRIAESG